MEENEKTILETTGFVSKNYGADRRNRLPQTLPGQRAAVRTKQRKKRDFGSAYLLLRLGVCAFLFFGVLGMKLFGSEGSLNRGSDETGKSGDRAEDSIGRLKFVELPSIIDVFAPSPRAVLPAVPVSFELSDEDGCLTIVTNGGDEIVSPVDGNIRTVGYDENLGKYVTVTAEGDVEFTIYGLGEVYVEPQQPVKQRAVLGKALGDSVAVRAYASGRPLDLSEVFDLGKAG